MPRQARLDAPGTLHHVIVRGIEKRQIVDDDKDRKSFDDIGNRFINELDGADEDTLKSMAEKLISHFTFNYW